MKIKDIKEVFEFLDKDGMCSMKRVVKFISSECPNEIDLIRSGSCFCTNDCFECWRDALNMEENQDKLENEI